jgi:hypothetical protein
MTEERIAGFLLGLSMGTVIGFLLRRPEHDDRKISTTPRDSEKRETLKNQAAQMGHLRPPLERRKTA